MERLPGEKKPRERITRLENISNKLRKEEIAILSAETLRNSQLVVSKLHLKIPKPIPIPYKNC